MLTAAVQQHRDTAEVASPVAKRPRRESHSNRLGLDDVLDELLGVPAEQQSPSQVSASVATDALNEQIRLFLLQPNIPRQGSALSWWRDNAAMFPDIAAVAQRYLSAPATSVPSERLFSSDGLIYTDRCNRLLPEKAEQLLFIKHNLSSVAE